MRQIAAANGDRIVKSRIDGSYQLVDAGTDKVIWPTHVQASRIGATFNELSERIFGGDGMSARNYWETCSEIKKPDGALLTDPLGNIWKVVPSNQTTAPADITDAMGAITFVRCSEVKQ